MRSLFILLLLLPTVVPPSHARNPAPGAECLDARRIKEVRQPDARTLAILAEEGGRLQLKLAGDCPAAVHDGAKPLARDGWVCGHPGEYLRTDGRSCPLAALRTIDAAGYARLARASARTAAGVVPLEAVQVTGERRRGFPGSSSYCFDPRYLRAWSEDRQGIVVETSPRRAGSNRYYRVELADTCPELFDALNIGFESGVGIGLICRNPGDRVVALSPAPGLLG